MSASTSAVLRPSALAAPRARGASSRARRAARVRASRRDDRQIFARASSKADGASAGDGDDATEPEARDAAGEDAADAAGAPKPPSWFAKISEAEASKEASKEAKAASPSADAPSGAPEPSGLARLVPSPVRAWLASIPAKRKAERLEGLLLAAEADRDSFVKQDAYMRELAAEEMWDEVVARFESRTAASGPGSVVAYLRAMAATGRLEAMDGMDARVMPPAQLSMAAAGVMRDENVTGEQAVAAVTEAVAVAAAERSTLPEMLTDLSSRARGVEGAPKLAPGRSPSVPLHVVVVPEGGGYDPFGGARTASKSRSAARSGGLIDFVFYGALFAVIGGTAMGAAQRHASKVTTSTSGSSTSVTTGVSSTGASGSGTNASPGGGAAGLLPGSADAGGKRSALPGVGGDAAGKSSFDPKEYDAGAISEQSRKTFNDVKGCDEAKAELQEIVEYLKNPDLFTKLGGKLPKGVLLSGPPGTGKTLLARAVAGEAGVPFFYRAGSEFEEMFVGVGSKRVRQLFKAAKAKMPCIIFIDEIDAVGTSRKAFETQSRKTLNQLLTEMDGFEQNEGIIVIAATNIPEQLDPALTRPGRFDRLVHVPNPDIGGRREILAHYLENKPVDADVDVESIARGTSGFSGAELFNLVNMAAVQAAVSGETAISLERLEWAKDRIVMGVERKSAVLTEESKKLTAYHEAGHAVVALRTPGAMPVHKATIVPRGNALGMVTQLPDKDETSITRKQLLARLDVCMGGRVAEELIFGKDEVTTGALSDLQQATRLATYMVGEVGLSSLVGPVHVDSMSKGGRRATEALVDKEVVQLLRDSHARVTKLLTKHVADLHALSAEMLARETLTGPEIVRLLGLETKDKEKQGAGKRGRGAPVEKAKEDAGGKEKAKAEERAKAKAGETDGGARAGGDDGANEPDADAIPAGILEPVEDRAKASTPA